MRELFPNGGRKSGQELGILFGEELFEKVTTPISEGELVEEVLGIGKRDPAELIRAKPSPRNQIMDVRMIDEGTTPGLKDAEQGQLSPQTCGVLTLRTFRWPTAMLTFVR